MITKQYTIAKVYRNKWTLAAILLIACFSSSLMAQDNVPTFSNEARATVQALPAVVGAQAIAPNKLENRPVLVTFFASWCPPCRDEFKHLNELQEKYSDTDLQIIAINVYEEWDDNDGPRMEKFIQTTQPNFPAVVGSENIRDLFGGIVRIPTVYGFNRQGELSYNFIHKRGSKHTNASLIELENAAKTLLAQD